MVKRYIFILAGIMLFTFGFGVNCYADTENPAQVLKISVKTVPESFPEFYFEGHDKEAQILNNYLWYHFSNRIGNMKTVFNKEYLTLADMWLADAYDKSRDMSIQDCHREDTLATCMDPEGYIYSHQMFSHAHDLGWPFPVWVQATYSPMTLNGMTAGWHFQDKVPGMLGDIALNTWKSPQYMGETATKGWELDNVKSLGIYDNKWQLESTGNSPSITTPKGMEIDSFQAPFVQLRWTRTGKPRNHAQPYIEWMREDDKSFGSDRRVYFDPNGLDEAVGPDSKPEKFGLKHCLVRMYDHKKWNGRIKRIRIALAPNESDVKFTIDSFFTAYDTRHAINDPIFIFASWNYFRWSGDIDFLRKNIGRMRTALRYQQTVMNGLKYNHIRNTWPGHDGLPGWYIKPDTSNKLQPKITNCGHGIGSNYFDLLPFGWDDMYSTSQYYASTLAMASAEDVILANPGWNIPGGALAFDPAKLRKHAAEVKKNANKLFWNDKKGRFIGCIDKDGKPHDYGFTFVNLDAIWYGIASDEHTRKIMDWIDGKRIVKGDTSTGADIYKWRFGPRSTTVRNLSWYGQSWIYPEAHPWGGQVQDGGAVLGFTFYDLYSRLKVLGPDNAWKRLCEIINWEDAVWKEGGYRAYYKDGKRGTTLQGGNTAGGIGIDFEFFESSLMPSIVTYGFMGINPTGDKLVIDPKLPSKCAIMGIDNILYHNTRLNIKTGRETISIEVKDAPLYPIYIKLPGKWKSVNTNEIGNSFSLTQTGTFSYDKIKR